MSRTDTIARITAKLATLDDAGVEAVADFVRGVAESDGLPRPLTERELALIEQSKADFKAGRTLSLAEARARTDAFLAQRRAARAKT